MLKAVQPDPSRSADFAGKFVRPGSFLNASPDIGQFLTFHIVEPSSGELVRTLERRAHLVQVCEVAPEIGIALRCTRRDVFLGWSVGLSGGLHRAREDERKAGVKSSDFRSSRMPPEARESCDRWLVPCGVVSES